MHCVCSVVQHKPLISYLKRGVLKGNPLPPVLPYSCLSPLLLHVGKPVKFLLPFVASSESSLKLRAWRALAQSTKLSSLHRALEG